MTETMLAGYGTDYLHYRNGWNDTANGLLHWTGSDKYPDPETWAKNMKKQAQECLSTARESHNRAYYRGVIACVNEYLVDGSVAKQ